MATDFEVMLNWYVPDTDIETRYCIECGIEVISKTKNAPVKYCPDCYKEHVRQTSNENARKAGRVKYVFDDPIIDLVYAVLKTALDDRDWQRTFKPDKHDLNLVDCGAQEFIEDGGVELWLRALGINVRPSMSKRLRDGE